METLAQGTIENLIVDVTDRLGGLVVLPPTTFEVRNKDGTVRQASSAAVVSEMSARCLVNTAGWPKNEYHLYLTFVTLPETPLLGPFKFLVN